MGLLLSALPVSAVSAAGSRVSVHDPSVIKDKDGSYFIIGSHLGAARSNDLVNWTWAANSNTGTKTTTFFKDIYTDLAKANTWANTSAGYDLSGNLWAPDIVWNPVMNKYCMYLSVNGENWHSSIVLCTADNLEGPYKYVDTIVYSGFETKPANAANSYKNTDVEKVLGANPDLSRYLNNAGRWNAEYGTNAIDPGVFYDEAGNLWMVYGSWFGGIYMLELDENTGLRDYNVKYPTRSNGGAVQSDAYLGTHVAGGHWVSGEGPYIEYMKAPGSDKGYYYLFLSYGYFNNKGGYNMRIFRSEDPAGPYVDMNGNSAIYAAGGDNIAGNIGQRLMSNYQWDCNAKPNTAQGHNSALMDDDGKLYVIYHNKFDDNYGAHEVRVHQLVMNEDGWFSAAPYEYSGESISPNGHTPEAVTGDYRLIWHNPNQKFENEKSADVEKPISITLHEDGTVTGDITATWEMRNGTPYMSFTWGGVTYKGTFIVQEDEATAPVKRMCFTATGINICIWGSKTEAYDRMEDLVLNDPASDLVFNWDSVKNTMPGASLQIGETDLLSGVSYYIINQNSGMSLDLPEGKTEEGTNLRQWAFNGSFAQQFRIIAEENGWCRIASLGDEGKVIAVAENSAADGTNVELQSYTGADNQLFRLVQEGNNYGILSKCSDAKSALDVYEWSKDNGANIAQYPYQSFACQLFAIRPVAPAVNDGVYSMRKTADGQITGAFSISKLDDGSYDVTDAAGATDTCTVRCNTDGSYTFTKADGQETAYVLEPVFASAEPERIRGDVNANGALEVMDIVMMQKYLLNLGSLTDWEMGDMNGDETLDIFDLALMKRELLLK